MISILNELKIGDVLYSPLCGCCSVVSLEYDEIYCITVRTPYGGEFSFDKYGRFALGGEVLLRKDKEE